MMQFVSFRQSTYMIMLWHYDRKSARTVHIKSREPWKRSWSMHFNQEKEKHKIFRIHIKYHIHKKYCCVHFFSAKKSKKKRFIDSVHKSFEKDIRIQTKNILIEKDSSFQSLSYRQNWRGCEKIKSKIQTQNWNSTINVLWKEKNKSQTKNSEKSYRDIFSETTRTTHIHEKSVFKVSECSVCG